MNFKESCIVIFIFSLNFDLIYTKCVKIEDTITLDSEVLQSRFKKLTMLKNSEDPALWDWDLKPSRFGNEEKKNHEQTWILLHGVGGYAEHMIPFAEIIAQRTPSAQIIIPQA